MKLRLLGTITSITATIAAVTLDDGQVITVPTRDLTPQPQVGDSYEIAVTPATEANLDSESLARTILNQLLANVPITEGAQEANQEG